MNETTPKISVIVPVYKAENYLHRCVDSLLAQTFQDFEILLIDDGSPDRSGEICDEYAKKDKRVRVFHKKNGGVSSARNLGLDNARGEWICFVDSDDWVDKDTFACCGDYFCESDLIRFSYTSVFSIDGCTVEKHILIKDVSKEYYIAQLIEQKTYVAVWGALFKRELFTAEIRFDTSIAIGEDWLMFICLVSRCNNVTFLNRPLYQYNQCNEDSSISTASVEKMCTVFRALRKIGQYVDIKLYAEELNNIKLILICRILGSNFKQNKFGASYRILSKYIDYSLEEIFNATIASKYKCFLLFVWLYKILSR